jgi:hypothetical protein
VLGHRVLKPRPEISLYTPVRTVLEQLQRAARLKPTVTDKRRTRGKSSPSSGTEAG